MNASSVAGTVIDRQHSPQILLMEELGMKYPGTERAVLQGLTFDVRQGELACVVGPSGAGKTTFIRCVAGLLRPTQGYVDIAGKRVTSPSRDLAVVFQDYSRSLLPWMTVMANVTFPLRDKKVPKDKREKLATSALAEVGLDGFGDRYPWQLSGGMQQRVAIARALAVQPKVLLMDEPFASVDAQTRADLEDLVLRVRDDLDMTIVFVTHDIDEAVYLGNRVVVFGGTPTTVLEEVAIELPHARDQVATKELPEFAHLRAHVLNLIRSPRNKPGQVAQPRR